MRDFDLGNPEILEIFETACRFPNADYLTFMAMALFHAESGRTEEASHYLELAMKRYPPLSLAHWRTAFHFPTFPRWLETQKGALETLVDLGLPRE